MTGAKECWSLLHGAPDGVNTMHEHSVACLESSDPSLWLWRCHGAEGLKPPLPGN